MCKPENSFARISWHLEQEEAGIAFRQKIIRRIIFIQNLDRSIDRYKRITDR